jgi:hypothetical protein
MDQDHKKSTKNKSILPDAANDQLGENAAMEFSQEYDNKSDQKIKSLKQKILNKP